MNLTYTTTKTGYSILNDGVIWIVQDGFIPYPADTMAESAEKHIEQILQDAATATNQTDEIAQIKEDNAMIAETLAITLVEIEQLKAEMAKGA